MTAKVFRGWCDSMHEVSYTRAVYLLWVLDAALLLTRPASVWQHSHCLCSSWMIPAYVPLAKSLQAMRRQPQAEIPAWKRRLLGLSAEMQEEDAQQKPEAWNMELWSSDSSNCSEVVRYNSAWSLHNARTKGTCCFDSALLWIPHVRATVGCGSRDLPDEAVALNPKAQRSALSARTFWESAARRRHPKPPSSRLGCRFSGKMCGN